MAHVGVAAHGLRIIYLNYDWRIILTYYDLKVILINGRTVMKHLVRTSKNLGHAIREARKAKNLTQKELASMSGVWQETISKIENGSGGTKLETLFDLIAALDLEITVTERSKGASDGLEDIF
jgi:HTH-type transcriptional regulator/antitoxin HipB